MKKLPYLPIDHILDFIKLRYWTYLTIYCMKFIEITYSKIRDEIQNYLTKEFNKSGILYSPSSPYGQILMVIENLHQLSMLYLKNTISQFDIGDPDATNERFIKNAAIFAGHIPSRAISATGTLRMALKVSTDIEKDIPGSRITLFNKQALKNKTNGLDYAIMLGKDKSTYNLQSGTQFNVNVVQGKWDSKNFTGTGDSNQSIQIALRGDKDIENSNVEVLVDGEYYEIKKHIYDMIPGEKACVVRTGFNSGIDIFFGNENYGTNPRIGALIEVNYIISDGANGSIFRRTFNDWTFIDTSVDGFGNTIDISQYFDISILTDINFGADREDTKFTKSILPIVSNNFVLGTPEQYAYQIKKLGVFSYVNAYEQYGDIYIIAAPNIKLFRNQNADYFNVDINAFYLDKYEIAKISKYLKSGGNIMLTKRFEISSPKLSYYAINIFVRTYSDTTEESVRLQIHDKISNYFLNMTRIGRIPKLDIIKELSTISDIYSVDLSFMSKKNEDYHREYIVADQNRRNQFANMTDVHLDRPDPTYDPTLVLGIDKILGDIILDNDEYPIIRGNWSTRDDIFISGDINDTGLTAVNVIFKGTEDASKRALIQSANTVSI